LVRCTILKESTENKDLQVVKKNETETKTGIIKNWLKNNPVNMIKIKKYNNRNKNNNNRQNFDQKIKLKECKRIKIGKQRAIAFDSRKNNKTTETE
jgi:hypothetical protein